jgi:UDP-2,4-diacetamido-2,4,6-trideoxy-beta-L-altropyranose hydrolase
VRHKCVEHVDEQTLLVRADASVTMGTGHVMRCLALAQAWQDAGGSAVFAMAQASPMLRERLRTESIAVCEINAQPASNEDAAETIAVARRHSATWVVVDGYQFDAEYQRALKNAGLKVLFLDDYGHAAHYYADLILNQNLSAQESLYENRETYSRLLLGTKYCLLRREFTSHRKWQREIVPVGHRVLITMGGSDPENFTEKAVAALESLDNEFEAVVVIGGSNISGVRSQMPSPRGGKKITVLRDVSNMAELMAWADVAISAAGTTCWELCRMGLPSLLIDLARNQTQLAEQLDQRGCAIHLGSGHDVTVTLLSDQLTKLLNDSDRRRRLSRLASALVDRCGAKRVVSALKSTVFHLRPARQDDCRLLWEWANDEQVRSASFSSAPIPWNTHIAWFNKKLRQNGSHLWIAEDEGQPVGQVRFDQREDGEYEIAVSLRRDRRGRGLAVPLITQALQSLSTSGKYTRIHAFVKPENAVSLKAFARSGFERVAPARIHGQPAIHFIFDGAVRTNKDAAADMSALDKEHAS